MKTGKIIAMVLFCGLLTTPLRAESQMDFVPKPAWIQYGDSSQAGSFILDKNTQIVGGDPFNVRYLKTHLERVFDPSGDSWGPAGTRSIEFVRVKSFAEEAYSIEVSSSRILVTATTRSGEFYAIQTLLQMLPAQVYRRVSGPDAMLLRQWEIPCLRIVDEPRFSWRGSMLDVSRTFFDKDYILRHLDFLAYHKINKFHWHLTDDNGWRVEIKKYPRLTQVGAWRGRNEALMPAYNSGEERYGGFYTQEEIREIVAYAADRNIEIIPEFDLPGHSKALTVSYPEVLCRHDEELESVQGETRNVICVGREKNYVMLENIIKELAALFPSKYFHIGVEEVVTESWKHCPECRQLMEKLGCTDERQLQDYFAARMEKILLKYGKTLEGWEDIVSSETLSRNDLVLVWHGQKVMQKALDAGFPVVTQNSEYLYFDMKYSPLERGLSWAALINMEKVYSFDPLQDLELTEAQQKLVRGLQGGLWAEMLYYPPHFSEYQMFPRLCALAEIGWTPQALRDYADFDARLARSHFERLWQMGIRFRVPYPEVDAQCHVRSPYPSMVVRYTFDGSEPTVNSPVVTGSIVTDRPENLRFATFYNDIKSITVDVPGARKYLTPATRVSTSLVPNRHSKVETLELYARNKILRTAVPPRKGDYVLYTFETALTCRQITVQTADPVNHLSGITQGHVEVQFEGDDHFKPAGTFDMYNRVVIRPDQPVRAVKIVVDGPCEGKAVCIQSLLIE